MPPAAPVVGPSSQTLFKTFNTLILTEFRQTSQYIWRAYIPLHAPEAGSVLSITIHGACTLVHIHPQLYALLRYSSNSTSSRSSPLNHDAPRQPPLPQTGCVTEVR